MRAGLVCIPWQVRNPNRGIYVYGPTVTSANGTAGFGIFKLNTLTSAFSALTASSTNNIGVGDGLAIHPITKQVYAGGGFIVGGGISANRVAYLSNGSWVQVGAGLPDNVNAICFDSAGNLYAACGTSSGTGSCIKKYDGVSWTAFGGVGTLGNISGGYVRAMKFSPTGDMHIVGTFTNVGGVPCGSAAKLVAGVWVSLNTGSAPALACLAFSSTGTLVVGGNGVINGKNNIAEWVSGTTWRYPAGTLAGASAAVSVVEYDASDRLWAGGDFTTMNNISLTRCALLIGVVWTSVGTFNSAPEAIVFDGVDVYIAGNFILVNGATCNRIAKSTNGGAFLPIGVGLNAAASLMVISP